MKHAFLDTLAYRESPIHRMAPNLKLGTTLVLLTVILLSGGFDAHTVGSIALPLFVCLSLTLVLRLANLPFLQVLKRSLIILPLVVMIVVLNILARGPEAEIGTLALRALASLFTLVTLVATTRMAQILEVLANWHVPRVLLLTLSFMYRYLFLLSDEVEKLRLSYRARYSRQGYWSHLQMLALISGMVLIRSFDRAQRVYHAMVMRGYGSAEW